MTNQIEHTSPTLKYVCIVSYFTKHSSFLQKLCWVPANFTQKMILTHRFAFFSLLHPPIHSFFWGAPSVRLLFLWCTLWLELWDFPITPQKPLLKRNGHLDPTNAPKPYMVGRPPLYLHPARHICGLPLAFSALGSTCISSLSG